MKTWGAKSYVTFIKTIQMSRIGKNPINIPQDVEVNITGNVFAVKGKFGQLVQSISNGITVEIEKGKIIVERQQESKDLKAKHGLMRALFSNMIIGVSKGWTKELELVGVGYRASSKDQVLDLALGFSHNIILELAPEVKVETVSVKGKNPIVKLFSCDKQLVGQVAAKIRSFRKPEPYKGKGIKFTGEITRRKAGKSA